MPRANDKSASRGERIPIQSSFSGGGRSNPVAALVAQQQQQNTQFQKLLKTIEDLQAQNAQAVQQAGQAAAGAATEVANQVASGIDRMNQEKDRKQTRAEDRAYAEDMARLNASLQSDAAREAAAMGQAIQGQREAMMRFTDQFKSKKASIDEAISAYSARTDEMLAAGWFSSPEGRRELKKRKHLIDMMQAYSDDHFDDRHLEAAYELHNKNIQAIIDRDQNAMDLSRLQVDPLQLPMAQVKKSGKKIAPEGSIDPEKMFEMKLYGGYPARGVVFNDEPNFGMPDGYSPKLADADTLLEVMGRDDYLRFASDKSIRQELQRQNQQIVVQALDRLQPLKEQYENFNKTFNSMAPNAVERALENFLAEDNPNKFNDMGRTLTALAIQEMFGGGSQGEKMAVKAMQLFDGKAEMTTPQDAFAAMALESAAFNIKEHMTTEFMNSGDEGGSLATQLVKQMVDELGEENTALALGVDPTAVGLVRAQDVMQGRLSEAISFADRMHQGLWQSSVLESFRKDLRKYTRLADLYSMQVLKEGENNQRRVMDLMSQDAALTKSSEDIATASPDEVAARGMRDSSKVQADMLLLDSMIQLGQELGPDTLSQVATFVTGGMEPADTPNLQSYLDQTLVEQERSGYARAASQRASFNQRRQERARAARDQQGPQNTVKQSFEQGGAVGVVREQLPALVSLAGKGVEAGIARTATGAVQAAAGRGPAESFLRNYRTGQGAIGAGIASAGTETPNLTQQERSQVLRESMKPLDRK